MGEFELIKKMVIASNSGNQCALSELIDKTDFSNYPTAKVAALNCFDMTDANTFEYKQAAIKLSKFSDINDFRGGVRVEFLREKLNSLGINND